MEPTTVKKEYIESTAEICGGRPRIVGHRIRVQDIVLWSEQGKSPDEIVAAFPQLTFAMVHSALAYYFDHQGEIDADIRNDDELVATIKSKLGRGPISNLD